ncbi:uncharacterized protein LOC144916350 [Branchiostoma floridae x Branchiostoma belcheri]
MLLVEKKLQVYTLDGTLVNTVGAEQGMMSPWYVAVDHNDGNILVSDFHNHCVYVYAEDGRFLFKFGGEGDVEGQLKQPRGICTDGAGNIIVADSWNHRVELFDKTGAFLRHVTTEIRNPHAVAMTMQGWLVVTGSENDTFTVFKPDS